MKASILLLPIMLAISLASCRSTKDRESIEGLWKCTPETALDLGSTVLEAHIYLDKKKNNNLSIKGCFVESGEFRDYWRLDKLIYDRSNRELIFSDQQGSTYFGTLNPEGDKITGAIYTNYPEDPVEEDKLDFTRACDSIYRSLFEPRQGGKDGKITYTYTQPHRVDKLQTASIYAYLEDPSMIDSLLVKVIRQDYGRIESLLILKDSKLLVEEYFYDYNRNQTHNIHSVTKSIVSLLCGMVLFEGGTQDLDRDIESFYPSYHLDLNPDLAPVSLKQVLTMTAGFEDHLEVPGMDQIELVNFILNLNREFEPGTDFKYSADCSSLLGGIIQHESGLSVEEYARKMLFAPLDIKNYRWNSENGISDCHSNLELTAVDMVKIGLMVLQKGKWEGKQIINESWITESTKPQVREDEFLHYGFQWRHHSSLDKQWWKMDQAASDDIYDMPVAVGFGGQYIFLVPELEMAVITYSSDYNEADGMAFSKFPMVIEQIIPMFDK